MRLRKVGMLLLVSFLLPAISVCADDYKGNTLIIPCDKGGLNFSQNIDSLPITAMLGETRNLNMHNSGREKRGGTSISDATITSSQIMWIYKYQLKSGTGNLMTASIDGKMYEDGNLLSQGMAVGNYYSSTTFEDELFVVDGSNLPHVWNGSDTVSQPINSPHSNWAANAPFQTFVHQSGNSQRVIMLNTDAVYFSSAVAGGGQDFSSAEAHKIAIDTGDGLGLQGGEIYGAILIVFGKSQAWRLDDSSVDKDDWKFLKVQWNGGVVNWRCIIKIDNNLVLMAEDGTIYDVATVEQFGDYRKSSLTHPAKIDKWIADNVNLSQSINFHGVYDPSLRAIKYFVWRKSRAAIDTALVFFIDRGPLDGWMIHGNWANPSGYDASVSAVIRESAGVETVYTGDYSGRLWKLEQGVQSDNSQSYFAGFEGVLHFNDPRRHKQVDNIWLVAREEGDFIVSIETHADVGVMPDAGFSLLGDGFIFSSTDQGVFSEDRFGGDNNVVDAVINTEYGIELRRLFYKIYTTNTSLDFFINELFVDFTPLDRRPD